MKKKEKIEKTEEIRKVVAEIFTHSASKIAATFLQLQGKERDIYIQGVNDGIDAMKTIEEGAKKVAEKLELI